MPGTVRRVLIFAAVDGLILQPAPPRNHKPTTEQAIKVEYRTNAISPLLKDRRDADTAPTTFDAHGIVGTRLPDLPLNEKFLLSLARPAKDRIFIVPDIYLAS